MDWREIIAIVALVVVSTMLTKAGTEYAVENWIVAADQDGPAIRLPGLR